MCQPNFNRTKYGRYTTVLHRLPKDERRDHQGLLPNTKDGRLYRLLRGRFNI